MTTTVLLFSACWYILNVRPSEVKKIVQFFPERIRYVSCATGTREFIGGTEREVLVETLDGDYQFMWMTKYKIKYRRNP